MSMSRDRIEFTMTENHNRFRDNSEETARAASRAFGFSVSEARMMMRINRRIRCRPSQFARFIAFRIEEGVSNNRIRDLDIKHIPAIEEPNVLDVSKNPSSHCDKD